MISKERSRGDMDRRGHDEKTGIGQGDGGDFFADTFRPADFSAHEDRHIGAKLEPERCQCILTEAGVPQVVQRNEYRGCVRAAAAEPAAYRQPLVNGDAHPESCLAASLQQQRGPLEQILLLRNALDGIFEPDKAVVRDLET